jgi:hypothetical protein
MNRSPGTGAPRLLLPAILLVAGLAAGGCGVAVAVDTFGVADLRVEEPVTITVDPFAGQTVSGTVVNLGDLVADDVQVTLTVFAVDAFGRRIFLDEILRVPVVNPIDRTQTLFPGEHGDFAVFFPFTLPRIRDVDVQIEAQFRADGQFQFFFFTPGVVFIFISS